MKKSNVSFSDIEKNVVNSGYVKKGKFPIVKVGVFVVLILVVLGIIQIVNWSILLF